MLSLESVNGGRFHNAADRRHGPADIMSEETAI